MQSILDAINEWIKEILIGAINGNLSTRKRVPTSVNPRYDADAPDGDFACWEVSQTLFCGGLHPLKIFKKLWQKCGCAVVGYAAKKCSLYNDTSLQPQSER